MKWNIVEYHLEWSWNEAILRAKCPAFEGLAPPRVCLRPDHYVWLAVVSGQAAGLTEWSKCKGCSFRITMRRARMGYVGLGVHFAHISKSMDLYDKTKCIQRLVARQGIWMETSTAIPVVERHIARTHTHAEPCNCCFDFTCRNAWAQAMWWKRMGKPEENIFWSPLPGCHWLTLHALFCRWFYWKTKGLPHFQLESWARYFVLNLSKLCMFPTLFVQRVTNLQLETWPGSKASGSIKPRVKTTENGLRTGRRHGRWLAAMQQFGTYFFPLRAGAHVKVVTIETETDLNMSCHPAILVQERSKEFRRLWDEMDTNSYDPPYQALFELWIEDWWWHVMMWFLLCWCS